MISLTAYDYVGPEVILFSCNGKDNQIWIWNETDGTISSKVNGEYLTVKPELEVWAGPLFGGSQAVVLLNGGDSGSSEITVQWADIGFPVDHAATIRDLMGSIKILAHSQAITQHRTLDSHAVMMFNITLTK